MLQHHPVIQMFTYAHDLSADHNIYQKHKGLIQAYLDNTLLPEHGNYSKIAGHSGYAWAYTRKALNDLGGLYDTGILGAGDKHMALCLLGLGEYSYNPDVSDGYKRSVATYQDRDLKYIKKNVGVLNTNLFHYFHGDKVNRQYMKRWQLLVRHSYSPETDLKRDVEGLYQLTDEKPELRIEIAKYFQDRAEDHLV